MNSGHVALVLLAPMLPLVLLLALELRSAWREINALRSTVDAQKLRVDFIQEWRETLMKRGF